LLLDGGLKAGRAGKVGRTAGRRVCCKAEESEIGWREGENPTGGARVAVRERRKRKS
jgi:hypothetical protein